MTCQICQLPVRTDLGSIASTPRTVEEYLNIHRTVLSSRLHQWRLGCILKCQLA